MAKKGQAKYTATISLIVMFAGFVLTIPWADAVPWVRFLQSGFEAGLVGGLADWFAVTALFRHPLGIPIPHTALLPNNRQRVTAALISTVQNELLSKESLMRKLESLAIAEQLLELIENQLHTEQAKESLVRLLVGALDYVPWDDAARLANNEVKRAAGGLDAADLLQKGVRYATEQGTDEKAIDALLDMAYGLVERPEMRDRFGAMASAAIAQLNTGGFMGFAVNAFAGFVSEEKMGALIQQQILREMLRLKDGRDLNRRWIASELRSRLYAIGTSSEQQLVLEKWKHKLVDELDLTEKAAEVLADIRMRLTAWITGERFADDVLLPFIVRTLAKVRSDEMVMDRLERLIRTGLTQWISDNHHKIGALIQENVDKFDNQTLIALMEDKIGQDLQWIRVNGAVCGFIIGLALAAVEWLV